MDAVQAPPGLWCGGPPEPWCGGPRSCGVRDPPGCAVGNPWAVVWGTRWGDPGPEEPRCLPGVGRGSRSRAAAGLHPWPGAWGPRGTQGSHCDALSGHQRSRLSRA